MIAELAAKPLMLLGTTSGSGKSLMSTAICRVLSRSGEKIIPFKGQNMSNNAWVDTSGGEMAYSQALQAWAAGVEPLCIMNPILLKPKSDGTSEVIHLGKSVGNANALTYYDEWFVSGWKTIRHSLNELKELHNCPRLVVEGAGSPVEVNLQHRDLTNLRLAQYLKANCILVADIERGGVFAQILGTLSLLRPIERTLIKGILINKFRGRRELFEPGRIWLQQKTGIPVLGIMPWLDEIFPPEDSLDLFSSKAVKPFADLKIFVIKLPSISNFSDLDPLNAEPSVDLRWVGPSTFTGNPDCVIVPGSKQTLRDLDYIKRSGLAEKIHSYSSEGGNVFGICGGMQMLGNILFDPDNLEGSKGSSMSKKFEGLKLLPIRTDFIPKKIQRQKDFIINWPETMSIKGFEIHHGKTLLIETVNGEVKPLSDSESIGWTVSYKNKSSVTGTYLHGIFDNGTWRRTWLNTLRSKKGLPKLDINQSDFSDYRNKLLDSLADSFVHNINLTPALF